MRRAAAIGALALLATACGSHASRAGKYIVWTEFTRGEPHAVWIADADGRHAHVLASPGGFGSVSQDGRLVAYVGNEYRDLWVVRSDGKHARRLSRRVTLLGWLPCHRILGLEHGALVSVDAESTRVTVLDANANAGTSGIRGWSLSPDGSSVAYARPSPARCRYDVYAVRLATHRVRRLTTDGLDAYPVWGPRWIAVSRAVRCGAYPGIALVPPSGGPSRALVRTPDPRYAQDGYYGYEPYAWLLHGRLLIGLTNEFGVDAAVLDPAGHVRRLGYELGAISRDRRWLLGAHGGAEFPYTIFVVRLVDGHATRVARGQLCCPEWNR